jgi:hypothetical protein
MRVTGVASGSWGKFVHRRWCRYDTSIIAAARHRTRVAPRSKAIPNKKRSNEFSGNLEELIEPPLE